jgi:hypothetical protein
MKFKLDFKTTLPHAAMTTAYGVDTARATNVEMDTTVEIDPNHTYGTGGGMRRTTSKQGVSSSMEAESSKCIGTTTEMCALRGTMDATNSLNLSPMPSKRRA